MWPHRRLIQIVKVVQGAIKGYYEIAFDFQLFKDI